MITTAASATQTSSTAQPTRTSAATGLTSDFETFLMMLTAQARNQDPLEPLDSSEYASQLAQFSMVEQQVQTNDLLANLTATLSSVNLDELSNWIGVDVQGAASFRFDGQPQTIFTQPDLGADASVLVIKDSDGTEIDRVSVPVSETEFLWAGVDASGNPLPNGTYSATLESFLGDELLSARPAATYSRVVEAQVGAGVVMLTLDSGVVIPATDVVAVRTGA